MLLYLIVYLEGNDVIIFDRLSTNIIFDRLSCSVVNLFTRRIPLKVKHRRLGMLAGWGTTNALLGKCLKTSSSGQPKPCEGIWVVS